MEPVCSSCGDDAESRAVGLRAPKQRKRFHCNSFYKESQKEAQRELLSLLLLVLAESLDLRFF